MRPEEELSFEGRVRSRHRIFQTGGWSTVPKGAIGYIEDYADELYWVDFDEPYGVVGVEEWEIEPY